jgi:hypothetical protein
MEVRLEPATSVRPAEASGPRASPPPPVALAESSAPRPPEPSRVLLSLLARLWLLSNAAGKTGGAVASAPTISPPEPPAPTPRLEPPAPLRPPEPPIHEIPQTHAPSGPNDGLPQSGLGEFMVEVARASELPLASPAADLTREVPERVTVMIELPRQLRCHRYIEENPVSRDRCRLFARIENEPREEALPAAR